jgi:uncharacterized protein (DUF4415 family)
MASRNPLIDQNGEVGDLSSLNKNDHKPYKTLPKSLQAKLRGRPKAGVTKESVTIRLSPEVVQSFRASGAGWQTRMDAALKDWLKTHKVAS